MMNTAAAAASAAAKTKIADILPTGRKNAVTTKDLCNMFNIDVRELRKKIADERKDGAIILSDSSARGGYYSPDNIEEIAACVRTLDAKARSIMAALQSARKRLKEESANQDGQIIIDINI